MAHPEPYERVPPVDVARAVEGQSLLHLDIDYMLGGNGALQQLGAAPIELESMGREHAPKDIPRVDRHVGGELDLEIALQVRVDVEILIPVTRACEHVQ